MAKVDVTLINAQDGEVWPAEVVVDKPVGWWVEDIVAQLDLPKEIEGQPVRYRFVIERTGQAVTEEETLQAAGLREGDVVRLERDPTPSPRAVAPVSKAGLPGWVWALGGMVLLVAALAVGMLARRQAAERKAATAIAQTRATEQAVATTTAQTQATEQAAATTTAQVRATEQAVATATAHAWATEQAATAATAQARASEQTAATATAQTQATEQAGVTATAQTQATEQAAATATAQAQAAEQAAATATAQARAAEQTAATETAQAQATKQAAAASTATASVQHPSEAPSHWPIVFSDSFSTSENGWPMGDYDYDQVTLKILITNGQYRVEAIAHKKFTLWATHPMDFIPDFHLTADARQVSGPRMRAFGLVFRLTDGDNYGFFGISDDQQFLVRIKHQGEWTHPVDWTETTAIRPGEMNRLKVVAEGSRYLLFINDQKVGEVVDDLLSSGKAGFGLELDVGETAVFEFDNFELRAP